MDKCGYVSGLPFMQLASVILLVCGVFFSVSLFTLTDVGLGINTCL